MLGTRSGDILDIAYDVVVSRGPRSVRSSPGARVHLTAHGGEIVRAQVTARIISDIRKVNGSAYLCAAVRDPRWEPVVARHVADKVIAASRLTSRILGLAVRNPAWPGTVQDQLDSDPELVILQRMVTAVEVRRAPSVCGPAVVSVVRDGARFLPGDSEVAALRTGDTVELVRPLRSTDHHR